MSFIKMEKLGASSAGDSRPSPAELKQKESRQFKSKAPKPGQRSFDAGLSEMEGLEDSALICPWEEFGDVELSELAQFGTA